MQKKNAINKVRPSKNNVSSESDSEEEEFVATTSKNKIL